MGPVSVDSMVTSRWNRTAVAGLGVGPRHCQGVGQRSAPEYSTGEKKNQCVVAKCSIHEFAMNRIAETPSYGCGVATACAGSGQRELRIAAIALSRGGFRSIVHRIAKAFLVAVGICSVIELRGPAVCGDMSCFAAFARKLSLE